MPQQTTDRLHALDAVRAFALLSGIALHATMPFLAGLKGWVTTETPSDTLAAVWYVIHMFRMPVFFLIAGFFARMMLERRGLRGSSRIAPSASCCRSSWGCLRCCC